MPPDLISPFWLLLIPVPFAVLLGLLMWNQRKVDRLHREAMNSLHEEFESNVQTLKAVSAAMSANSFGGLPPSERLKGFGPGYVEMERPDGTTYRMFVKTSIAPLDLPVTELPKLGSEKWRLH